MFRVFGGLGGGGWVFGGGGGGVFRFVWGFGWGGLGFWWGGRGPPGFLGKRPGQLPNCGDLKCESKSFADVGLAFEQKAPQNGLQFLAQVGQRPWQDRGLCIA